MKRVRALWLAGLILLLLAVGAESSTLLILPFENQTRNANLEWISESLSEGLAERLAGPHTYVASREERAAAFDLLGIPAAGILSRATIIKLAETMDADYVIIGHYSLGGQNQLQASAQVLSMNPLRLSLRLAESGPLTELLEIQDRLAVVVSRELAPGAGGLPGGLAPMPKPHVRLDAWENYIRGLTAASGQLRIKYFREAARLDPSLGHAALELGKIYFQNRDYTTAAPWLAKLKSDHSSYLEAKFRLGICYFFLEEYEKAEAAFQAVAERVPLNEVHNNLGAAQSRRARRSALDNFRKAAEGDPTDPDYHFNAGYWHWKNGQHAPAVRQFRQVLEARPNDGEARALLAKSLERAGFPTEAAREREILARHPAAVRFTNLDDGIFEDLERIKRNYDERSFRQLQLTLETVAEENLSRLPAAEHAGAHLERGRELFREQSDSEALEELREAARLEPARAEVHLLLARLHERAGRREEAIREAGLALALENSVDAHLLLAKIFLEQDKLADAEKQAREALEVQPENVAARSVLKTIRMRTP